MHTKLFTVLSMLGQLSDELNVINVHEDLESTRAQYGTIADYRLQGRWIAAYLQIEDAARIAKETMSFLLLLKDAPEYALLLTKYDKDAQAIKN